MVDISLFGKAFKKDLEYFYQEDDLERNSFYIKSLPSTLVSCSLKFKSDLVISGLPYFFYCFKYLYPELNWDDFSEFEGREVKAEEAFEINFELPFGVALTGERLALNLLQHSSSCSTFTRKFVKIASEKDIKILDTRKTTPGLRALEKYAVRMGGGLNHRLGQSDVWMVKDNHKNFFGSISNAVDFFKSMGGFYVPIEVEIHDLEELKEAIKLGIIHVMLDNFSPEEIKEAIKIKAKGMTFEVSGGIRLEGLDSFLIEGVDAISIGALTYNAPHVDISLKYAEDNGIK